MATGKNQHGTIAGKLADHRDHAERLADGEHVDVRRHRVGELALQDLRDPARELDHLLAARDLTTSVAQDLAVLRRDDRRELVGARVEQLAEAEEHPGALGA
jgi:hypothetical protein